MLEIIIFILSLCCFRCDLFRLPYRFISNNYQLPIPKTCTTTREFDHSLSQAFKNKDRKRTETIFEILNARHNNVGGTTINFPLGSKNVYRSAILMTSIPCLYDLIKQCNIKHIIDISNPHSYNTQLWIDKEKTYFYHLVLTPEKSNYIHFNDLDYEYKNDIGKEVAFKNVAKIIHKIETLDGAVLVHCLGGEHKTGIVFGVMQKCFNKTPLSKITEEYKKHSAWVDEKNPGGFKQKNIEFVEEYPCKMVFNASQIGVLD